MKRNYFWLFCTCLFLLACGSAPSAFPDYPAVPFENGLYGFIDLDGETVIAPQFAYAMNFSEGLAAFNVGGTPRGKSMPTNGKWGFYGQDSSGRFKILINPIFDSPPYIKAPPYDIDSVSLSMHEGYMFSGGLAAVYHKNEWIYIDRAGNPIPDELNIRAARRFYNGLAAVYLDGKWGYVRYDSASGKIVKAIEPQYLLPVDFISDYAFVMTDSKTRQLIRRPVFGASKGNDSTALQPQIVLPYDGYLFQTGVFDHYAAIRAATRVERSAHGLYDDVQKIGFLNIHTNDMIPPQFDQVGHFGKGLCPVLVGSKPGSTIEYPDVVDYADFRGGKWGFIDSSGSFVIDPVFDDARSFSEGYAAVKKNHHWGYIDPNGNWLVAPRFKLAGFFHNGIAKVKMGADILEYYDKEALLNQEGKVIWIEP